MLSKQEIENILKTLPKRSGLKTYILQGYTLEEAKIKYKENTKSSKLYWIKLGYTEEQALQEINKRNPTKKLYWIVRGYTQEQATKKIKERSKNYIQYWELHSNSRKQAQQKYQQHYKEHHKLYVQYWLKKGLSLQQAQIKVDTLKNEISIRSSKQYKKEFTKICKEYWLKRGYSEEQAIKKAKQQNKNITKNISKQTRRNAVYLYLNNMTEQQKIAYDIKNKQHSIRMKEKNKTHSPIFIQYWLAKGYTYQKAIEEVQNCRFGNRKDDRSSKVEKQFFQELESFLNIKLKCQKWITINKNNYCIDAKYNNYIFEFNGTNFHMDSRFYKPGDKNPRGVLYQEVKLKDNKKIEDYKFKKYNIFIIWEYDYINNKEKLFQLIKENIQNGQKNDKENICWDSACIFNKCGRYT